MELNPITALFDSIEKLINEHGSAAILRDQVSLFRDQLDIFKERFSVLEVENETLKTENQNLKIEIKILKKKIQSYDKSYHDILLSEIETKIISFLAKQEQTDITPEQITNALKVNLQVIAFHLEDLKTKKVIESRPIAPFDDSTKRYWYLAQEGRRYLIKHKLIS